MTEPPTPPGSLPNHNPPDRPLNHKFQESIRSTQWEIQHQKQHVKQHVKHWFFATMVAGAGKGNFQLPDTACNSVSLWTINLRPTKGGGYHPLTVCLRPHKNAKWPRASRTSLLYPLRSFWWKKKKKKKTGVPPKMGVGWAVKVWR